MRLKTDFVTNSSSSSFIVAWPKRIKDVEQVKMFIEYRKSDVVFNDSINKGGKILKKTKRIINILMKEISSGYVPGCAYLDFEKEFLKSHNITWQDIRDNSQWRDLFYDEEIRKQAQFARDEAIKFIEKNEGSVFYIYEYSDINGEFYSDMEHGGTFNRLPHIQVSKH